ncbi:hypothetical protein LJB83_01080 [Clostridia bacterium OttesenSCG-928-F22]|nr:hypothetical protein [Clostridia bacterium OttesenSCG-928-F22]
MSAVNGAMYNTITQSIESNKTRTVNKTLGKNEFMNLLVAQFQNQDPLSPSSDTEFIAQLAQFSALEQMEEMNRAMVASQTYALVGKHAYVSTMVAGEEYLLFGKIDGVVNEGGISYLVIGEGKYQLSDVAGIVDVDTSGPTDEERIAQSANLIGKNIKSETTNEDNTKTTISGTVEKIVLKEGVLYAVVNDAVKGKTEVALNTITEIEQGA